MNKGIKQTKLAHTLWQETVRPGDIVIDATCGNGHDSLVLSTLALTDNAGYLFAIDIQQKAIENTKARLQANLPAARYNRVNFCLQCHSDFPAQLQNSSVGLIVYNLGYLPKEEDKALTTQKKTTLLSLQQAKELIMPGGAISITCYPGHQEGLLETEAILQEIKTWDSQWSVRDYDKTNSRTYLSPPPRLLYILKLIKK